MQPTSANFEFLRPHGQQLVRLASQAEHYFRTDPNTSLIKLRQFAELLAKEVGARSGSLRSPDEPFAELLGALGRAGQLLGQRLRRPVRGGTPGPGLDAGPPRGDAAGPEGQPQCRGRRGHRTDPAQGLTPCRSTLPSSGRLGDRSTGRQLRASRGNGLLSYLQSRPLPASQSRRSAAAASRACSSE
jgi:hypothetical protein